MDKRTPGQRALKLISMVVGIPFFILLFIAASIILSFDYREARYALSLPVKGLAIGISERYANGWNIEDEKSVCRNGLFVLERQGNSGWEGYDFRYSKADVPGQFLNCVTPVLDLNQFSECTILDRILGGCATIVVHEYLTRHPDLIQHIVSAIEYPCRYSYPTAAWRDNGVTKYPEDLLRLLLIGEKPVGSMGPYKRGALFSFPNNECEYRGWHRYAIKVVDDNRRLVSIRKVYRK